MFFFAVVKKAIAQMEDPVELNKCRECYKEANARLAIIVGFFPFPTVSFEGFGRLTGYFLHEKPVTHCSVNEFEEAELSRVTNSIFYRIFSFFRNSCVKKLMSFLLFKLSEKRRKQKREGNEGPIEEDEPKVYKKVSGQERN